MYSANARRFHGLPTSDSTPRPTLAPTVDRPLRHHPYDARGRRGPPAPLRTLDLRAESQTDLLASASSSSSFSSLAGWDGSRPTSPQAGPWYGSAVRPTVAHGAPVSFAKPAGPAAGGVMLPTPFERTARHEASPTDAIDRPAAGPPTRARALELLGEGDHRYLSGQPAEQAVQLWLEAAQVGPAERSVLFGSVAKSLVGHHKLSCALALGHFHVAWLAPRRLRVFEAFRTAVYLHKDLDGVMELMLAGAKKNPALAELVPAWEATFSPLVGVTARLQRNMVAAVRSHDFDVAGLFAQQLQASHPELAVAHWVSFLCDYERERRAQTEIWPAHQHFKYVHWARGMVAQVQTWDAFAHAKNQGALNLRDYRTVWSMLLGCCAQLDPSAFSSPGSNTNGPGPAPERCYQGLKWQDLLALPYPAPWAEHGRALAACGGAA